MLRFLCYSFLISTFFCTNYINANGFDQKNFVTKIKADLIEKLDIQYPFIIFSFFCI